MDAPTGKGTDGSRELDGSLPLSDLEEMLGLDLDEEDHRLGATVGELLAARLGRIPAVGDDATVAGHVARVADVEGGRVTRVRLLPLHGRRGR